MSEELKQMTLRQLREYAEKMGLNPRGQSRTSIEKTLLKKRGISPRRKAFRTVGRLGIDGKEGQVTEIRTANGRNYALKQFRRSKSTAKIEKEVKLQGLGSAAGISPKIKEYNLNKKYIIMQKLDKNLWDLLKKRRGRLTQKIQKQIIDIFNILDSIGVFHKDPNPLNFMFDKTGKLYILDYGFAEKIREKKHQSSTPNRDQMTLGLVLKLKELFPGSSYKILERSLPEAGKIIIKSKVSEVAGEV